MKYLIANRVTSLSSMYDTIVGGDSVGFQKQFTAFLQEYLALFCAPHESQGEGLPGDVLYAYLRSIWQGVTSG